MRKKLKEKISEALSSVLPITVIVLLLSFTVTPMPIGTLLLFLLGAAMLIVGMGFFSLGADMAMMPMGDQMGHGLGRNGSLALILGVCFLIGVTVTIAEPDLQVLAQQVPAVPDLVIILAVAAGVGLFLVVSMVRTRRGFSLGKTLVVLYVLVFVLSIFVPNSFLAVAFDAGGVTTGPITVPFLMALGAGLAGVKGRDEDNFGMVALCSVGPILAVMILGLAYQSTDVSYTPFTIPVVFTSQDVGSQFAHGLPEYMGEVAGGLAPIVIFFALFQIVAERLRRRALIKILVGVLYTYIGLVLFLTGANVGFMPAGYYLGKTLGAMPEYWALVPLGVGVGYFIVAAEPAVHVLNRQVEEVTSGAIPRRAIGLALSIGVAVSIGLAMLRVCLGIPIYYFLVPGYALALVLTRFVPPIFTAIAFDSGGVASGPMTATFLLPLTMGACEALGRDILTDAFGVVAMVAMTPLVTIQLLGVIYQRKLARVSDLAPAGASGPALEDDVIDYTQEGDL